MCTFTDILREVGFRNVASVTGLSLRQVYKWEANKTLPRSEFTGETKYALAISLASGRKYSEENVLEAAKLGRSLKTNNTP